MDFFDLSSLKATSAMAAFNLHEELVNEYISLLKQGVALQIGCSHGKDSETVLNGALVAMNRAIKAGYIKPDHPIVIITVDTLLEPEIIQSYVPFATKQVKAYCEKAGINAHVKIVSPPIYQELMILFAGAQKLPATSSSGRHADCSIIWKIDTSIRELKRIKSSLPLAYQGIPWVSVSGSRSSESTRRSNNMVKQNVKDRKANDLIVDLKNSKKKAGVYKFAPISDWSDKEVFNYLTHAGFNPIGHSIPNKRIEAFNDNFGVLLSIYGEGSDGVCEVVAMDDENKAEQKSCGKSARYGCVTCGLTSEDHSAVEVKKGLRWSRFGDSTRRFRDYMVRVASDVKYRGFHARAFDPSANNNVFLQPNVLKANVLEKFVWYASQITVDSREIHRKALESYNNGTIDSDVGVMDIMSDPTLSASVKEQYKEMYIARLIERPMFEMFTEKHAVLLSLMWSLHGVSSLPYRPLAILEAVKSGKRIPFPLTNQELNEKRASQGLPKWDHKDAIDNTIPDALVVQLFKPVKKSFAQLKAEHGENLNESHLQDYFPFAINDFWEKENVNHQAFGISYNRGTSVAKSTRRFKLTYTVDNANGSETISASDHVTGKKILLDNNPELKEELLTVGRGVFCELIDKSEENEAVELLYGTEKAHSVTSVHEFSNQKSFCSDVYFASKSLKKRKDSGNHSSKRKRVYDRSLGKYVAQRASLKVYTANHTPALEEQSKQTVNYWLPEFTMVREANIGVHADFELDESQIKQSFVFDDSLFNEWLANGGIERVLLDHNIELRNRIENRRPVRLFGGTAPVYFLTNNTGLTVTNHFRDYMVKTLKRTEVFNQAKLFSLANLSAEKISSLSNVVTMNVHRGQKANHLLAMRYLRNKRRAFVKSALADHRLNVSNTINTVVGNVSLRIQEFTEQYFDVAKAYLSATAFDKISPNSEMRSKKLRIWLQEFNGVVSHIDNAIALLATSGEQRIINDDYDAKNAINSVYQKHISALRLKVVNHAQKGSELISGLHALSGDNFELVGSNYEASSEAENVISQVASWLVANLKGVNSHLLQYGLTACLSQLHKHNYACPVFSYSNANSEEKLEKRSKKSQATLDMMQGVFVVENGSLSVLLNTVSSAKLKRQSVSKLSSKAKNKKLLTLISQDLVA